jgi:uncharacterized protein (TIGR03435 family)
MYYALTVYNRFAYRAAMTNTRLVTLLAIIASGLGASAQAPSPRFEVASVKVSTSNEPGSRMNTQPGRIVAHNVTLRALLLNAYLLRDTQLDTRNAPGWIATDRFDIEATMDRNATREQVALMMQMLLAERFGVVVRWDTQNRPVYSLAPVGPDTRLGSGMRPAPAQCPTPLTADCGTVMFSPGRLTGRSVSWAQIVNALSGVPAVDRLVIDGGGPAGVFDVELRWTPAGRAGGPASADVPESIFTAVQEQLALKLTPLDAAVPVIVVTDAKKPEAN